MRTLSVLLLSILFLTAAGCAERSADTEQTETAVTGDPAEQEIPADEQHEADYTDANGGRQVHNERYGFDFVIPAQYQAIDKSNNGDGYFIETGDKGTDIRIYGENIADNTIAAEMALSACERTEKFRFDNGYPGLKCYQGDDVYYYYDTPRLRITLYVNASDAWMQRNAAVIQSIAGSIRAGAPM